MSTRLLLICHAILGHPSCVDTYISPLFLISSLYISCSLQHFIIHFTLVSCYVLQVFFKSIIIIAECCLTNKKTLFSSEWATLSHATSIVLCCERFVWTSLIVLQIFNFNLIAITSLL